jgi:hypothetical protein
LREAEAGDKRGIYFVCFGAREATSGKSFNGSRIDDAHAVTGLMKVQGECLTICAGCFKAGVEMLDLLLDEPLAKLREANSGIWKDLVTQFAYCVESIPNMGSNMMRTPLCDDRKVLMITCSRSNLHIQALLHGSGFRYSSDLMCGKDGRRERNLSD